MYTLPQLKQWHNLLYFLFLGMIVFVTDFIVGILFIFILLVTFIEFDYNSDDKVTIVFMVLMDNVMHLHILVILFKIHF